MGREPGNQVMQRRARAAKQRPTAHPAQSLAQGGCGQTVPAHRQQLWRSSAAANEQCRARLEHIAMQTAPTRGEEGHRFGAARKVVEQEVDEAGTHGVAAVGAGGRGAGVQVLWQGRGGWGGRVGGGTPQERAATHANAVLGMLSDPAEELKGAALHGMLAAQQRALALYPRVESERIKPMPTPHNT